MNKLNNSRNLLKYSRRSERGQIAIIVVLALGLFLLAFTGLAVDYSNLWFHRQAAQGAADAACQAGAMDLYMLAGGLSSGSPATFVPGFTPTINSTVDCATTPAATPCKYAALNGYDGGGLVVGTESNSVKFSFPGTTAVPGVTPPPSTLAPVPFMRVDIVDRAKVFLSGMVTGSRTQDVRATAKCGLLLATSPIPIVVLHPTMANSFNFTGTPDIVISGGPDQSIQVNSVSSGAVSFPWGDGKVDLSQAGTGHNGALFGVMGGSADPPCTSPCKNWDQGTTGSWGHSGVIPDPFGNLAVPTNPGGTSCPLDTYSSPLGVCRQTGIKYGTTVTATTDPGCPVDPSDTHNDCTRYWPGPYPSGISVQNENAIFVPGVYYLSADLSLASNSIARPSAATGDNSHGTMFYFSGTAGIQIGSNSGGGKGVINAFQTGVNTTTTPPSTVTVPVPVQCPGGPLPNIPSTLVGNVFLGPCSGPYGDPLGQYRGMIFFHDRTTAAPIHHLDLNGGGGLLVAGNMYFHQNGSFGDQFNLSGNSGSDTRILGDIVVDQLALGGGGSINMELNPLAAYNILKVSLLQ